MLYSERYQVRIAGMGDYSTGVQHEYRAHVLRVGGVSASPMAPLAAAGASGGLTVELVYTPDAPALRQIMDRRVMLPAGAAVPPELAFCLLPGDSTAHIRDNGADLSGQRVWTSGEVLALGTRVASPTTGVGIYPVTRAGLGTTARAHIWHEGQPAPRIIARQPGIQGARIEIDRVDDTGGATVAYVGVVEGVSLRGSRLVLTVGSALAALRDSSADTVEYQPARPCRVTDGPEPRLSSLFCGPRLATLDTAPDLLILRVWWRQSWVVVQGIVDLRFNTDQRIYSGDVPLDIFTLAPVLQWGVGTEAYPLDRRPDGLPTEPTMPDTVQQLPFLDGTVGAAAAVQAYLQAQYPLGVGGLRAIEIGALGAIAARFSGGPLVARHSLPDAQRMVNVQGLVWPLPTRGRTALDWLAEGLLGPLGLGITADRLGRVRIVDWAAAFGGGPAVTASALRAELVDADELAPIRRVTLQASSGMDSYVSMAGQIVGGVDVDRQGMAWVDIVDITQTWISLVDAWGRPAVVMSVSVPRDVTVEPGESFSLSCPSAIAPDGTRGIVNAPAYVVALSYAHTEPTITLTCVVFGFLPSAVWTPSLGITAGGTGTALPVAVGDYGAGAEFEAGDVVLICDADGTAVATRTVASYAPGTLTLTSSVTYTAGQVVVLADYDDTAQRADFAWVADASATLGAANDPAYVYAP